MITYNVEGVRMPAIKKRATNAWIRAVAASHGRRVGEVGYMFVDDEKILEVNNEYLGHNFYTDVITFDYDEDDVINHWNSDNTVKPVIMATLSSASIPCAPMPNSSERPTTTNSTASSSTAFCTSVASMTRVPVSAS